MVPAPERFAPAFRDAWMARDGEAIGRLFVPDADFVNVAGIWWESREAIARAHGRALGSFFAETRLILGRSKIRWLGDAAAVVHQRAILDGQRAPDGTRAGRRHTLLLFVLRREAEGWIGVAAQNTDIVPGAETHLALAPARYPPPPAPG